MDHFICDSRLVSDRAISLIKYAHIGHRNGECKSLKNYFKLAGFASNLHNYFIADGQTRPDQTSVVL